MTGIQVGALRRSDRLLLGGALLLSAVAALGRNIGTVAPFLISAAALALLAGLVGRSVDQLADRLGPGAVGVPQAGLGNLPELFVCTFALRHGLTVVVSSALIGSILGNLLLVLGLAFAVGSVAFLVSDGASDWLEGATMIGLYILIAAAFWWG
jgi:Ca2+:H+ antiporter